MRERHPRVFRIQHLINLVSIAVLTVTGLYIYRPWVGGWMQPVKYVHVVTGFVLVTNALIRIYLAYAASYRDAAAFALRSHWHEVLAQLRYYLFLGPRLPLDGYNPLQRLAYVGTGLAILFQGLTGVALLWPQGSAARLLAPVGSTGNIRAVHNFMMWGFLAFVIVHVYLTLSETPEELRYMFIGGAPETRAVEERRAAHG